MTTGRVSVFGGTRASGWMVGAGGQWFTTDGYIPVSVEQDPGIVPRGPIDSELASEHRSGLLSVGYQAANGWRIDGSGSVFDEDRKNATPAAINTTASRGGSVEAAGGVGGGLLALRGFGGTQDYVQTYVSINATRTSEALNRIQRVPTRVAGFGGQWLQPFDRHALLLGAEMRDIDGATNETPVTAGVEQPMIPAGGTQHLASAFAQVTLNLGDRFTVVGGAHAGRWRTESDNTGYRKTLASFNPRGSFT
jgi:hypothetical protein